MLDARRLRTELDALKAGLARKGVDAADLDVAAALDERRRDLAGRRDELRQQVKALSKEVGRRRAAGEADAANEAAERSRALGNEERTLAAEADAANAALDDALLRIPNVPAADAPDGAGPEDNVVVRVEGFDPDGYGEHQRVPHWESGAALGLLDLERGAKIAGAMFPLYRGAGARLLRALTTFALDRHGDAFEEIRPPTLVRTETLVATGQLPKFADDAYFIERDGLWPIPTAEVPLTSLARDEVLDEASLPMRFTAASACYRREAGAAGRDTRGLLRTHEFDKVEILAYCTPDQAAEVHTDLLRRAEGLLVELELPYRVLDICTGDLGQSHARQYDLEVYAPGVDAWLEVSSVSWFSDYQARRANIRYRRATDRRIEHVHTCNGSALAWSRIWPALVETRRQPDGSITLPEALVPFFGSDVLARP
ncbi:MAG: serine--tRNA ligase [Acidimicrobiia bacterium]|nr:serine--tRNA ligase [Acidimicrobiia bacterium]